MLTRPADKRTTLVTNLGWCKEIAERIESGNPLYAQLVPKTLNPQPEHVKHVLAQGQDEETGR